MARVFLGIGTNMGNRKANIRTALHMLEKDVKVMRVSSIYETSPVGFSEQPDFLNGAIEIETDMEPHALLKALMDMEARLGRVRTGWNGPRTIDLDILLYDDMVMDEPGLTIPHPKMAERMFVLRPLCDIAPDIIHPVLGKTIGELREAIDTGETMESVDDGLFNHQSNRFEND